MTKELVNHPDHYMNESGVECIDIIDNMMFCSGNAFKYIYRLGKKDESIQEIRKAIFYLQRARSRDEVNVYRDARGLKYLVDKVVAVQHDKIGKAMLSIYYNEYKLAEEYLNDYLEIIFNS